MAKHDPWTPYCGEPQRSPDPWAICPICQGDGLVPDLALGIDVVCRPCEGLGRVRASRVKGLASRALIPIGRAVERPRDLTERCYYCRHTLDLARPQPAAFANHNGRQCCYYCAAVYECSVAMKGKIALYLVNNDKEVTNFSGTLRFPVLLKRSGSNIVAGRRVDVWFRWDHVIWYGTSHGTGTELCHCKVTKHKSIHQIKDRRR